MKNFLILLLDGYKGIGNSTKHFADLVNGYCKEIEKDRQNRERSVAEIHQHLSKKRNVRPGDRSPEKMRIDNLTKRLQLDLISDTKETKKLLDNLIEDLIYSLPTVVEYDLTDINVQQTIIKAMKAFKPETDLQRDFCNGLLARLPEAMQKHALNVICQEYRSHLETDIADLMPSKYKSVQLFIIDNPQGVKNGSEKLNTSIEKYQAVQEMQAALISNEPVKDQINNLKKVYHQKQGVLTASRDSATKKFCKKVLDFFSGYQFSNWIWGTQGKEAGKKMEIVYNPVSSTPSRISPFSASR